jgi:dihydroorotate dehydrogenase electron transfer subunit
MIMTSTTTLPHAAMLQETATIAWNRRVDTHYCRMGFSCRTHYKDSRPGQFVTLRLPDETSPLLRRPFSIHRLIRQDGAVSGIEILYKIVGTFTEKLSRTPVGATVDLLGPLGRGFSIDPSRKKIMLIAGGIGVAPLLFLADAISEAGMDMAELEICIGGRTSDDILCRDDFMSHGINVHITTEDGSQGEKGLVLLPAARLLKTAPAEMIYACGPMPLLKTVAAMARLHNIPCEISIETIMACGLAACLGCAVKTSDSSDGYRHVCKDGPVFDAATLTAL